MNAAPAPRDFSGRILELDGLRGVAIAMVLIYHYFFLAIVTKPNSVAGHVQALGRLTWTGVDLFFVLSGFLIGGILLDAQGSQNYFRTFYIRRFFRIVPLYALWFVVTCAAIVLIHWMDLNRFRWFLSGHLPLLPYAFFLQNFWMATHNTLGGAPSGGTWSLAIEEQFYLTLPAVLYFTKIRYRVPLLVAGVLMAPTIRILLHFLWHENRTALFVLMPCRADALLLGVLGAILLRTEGWKERLQQGRVPLYLALCVFLAGAAVLTSLDNSLTAKMDKLSIISGGYTWMACLYLLFILFAVTQPTSLIAKCMRWSPLRWLGTMAYGLYLIHDYASAFLGSLVPAIPSWGTNGRVLAVGVGSLALTLAIARLSWLRLEKPLLQLGHRYRY
ncbi:MAG TPA: acyltransferase [Candidatus Acidoferrum sp.]|nr:acyltransferase [Candidatus Acidoferrum sp.]